MAQMTIYPNGSAEVSIPVGQKIAIATYGNGAAAVHYKRARSYEFIRNVRNAQVVLGPFSDARMVRILAKEDEVYYRVAENPFTSVGGFVDLSTSITLTSDDDGATFACTTALTISIPELLSPRPSIVVIPPESGNVSLDPTGAAQLNGAGTTLTRNRTNNPAGVAVVAYAESDGYGVSGS